MLLYHVKPDFYPVRMNSYSTILLLIIYVFRGISYSMLIFLILATYHLRIFLSNKHFKDTLYWSQKLAPLWAYLRSIIIIFNKPLYTFFSKVYPLLPTICYVYDFVIGVHYWDVRPIKENRGKQTLKYNGMKGWWVFCTKLLAQIWVIVGGWINFES